MSATRSPLVLLGTAEELSAADVHLADPAAETLLRHLLDRLVDSIVDVTQGHERPSRTPPPPDVRALGPADLAAADRASCSALAALCQRAATQLSSLPDQPLAVRVAHGLRLLSRGLQGLVQDLPHEPTPVVRQRLLRVLRRAVAVLDGAAP
ncbi:hypothetical protein [Ornithinimicrobium murale]|uniref:hypothetical protein n=1 Tax=Ornithinimicrobium murale TaxID=1050153 RepID=UPI000E0D0F20|nr:hypothetical protein [Ornithinimicrobium murale]